MPSRALVPETDVPSVSSRRSGLSAVPDPEDDGPSDDPVVARRLYIGHLMAVSGIALSNALYALTFLTSLKRWRGARIGERGAPLLRPLALYGLLLAASVAASLDPVESLGELRDLLSLATLPLGILLLAGERSVRRAIDLVLGAIAIFALYGLGQYLLGPYGEIDHRIPGPFSHYQTFSGVLLVGCLLAMARAARATARSRVLLWATFTLLAFTLVLTLTRGPWVALVITGTAFTVLLGRRLLPRIALGVAAIALAVALFAPASWTSRVQSITDPTDPSNYDRLCMLEAGLDMIAERPLLGVGPRVVRDRYPIYRDPTAPRFQVTHLHNSHLQIAAERGLLSWAAYLWLMGAAAWLAWRAYRQEGGLLGPRADLHLAVLLVVIGFNVAGLFEANWRDTEIQRLVLFVLAIPACLGSLPTGAHR